MRIKKMTDGVLLEVKVKPRAQRFRVVANDELIIFCREPPIDGKANREIITRLSKILGSEVQLVSGFQSRKKQLFVRGLGEDEIAKRLIAAGTQK